MRVMVRDGTELIETKHFETRPIAIGSGQDCDIRLPDRRVLPRQALLSPRPDGTWVIEAAESGMPVTLNGRTVNHAAPIGNADEVEIGTFTLALYRTGAEELAEVSRPQTMVPHQVAELRARPLPPGSIVKADREDLKLTGLAAKQLAAYGQLLRACSDVPRLIDVALEMLLAEFAGRVVYAATRRNAFGPFESVHGCTPDGRVVDEPAALDVLTYRCLEHLQLICVPRAESEGVESLMAVPLNASRGPVGLLYVDRRKGSAAFEEADLDRLIAYAAQTAAQLDVLLGKQEAAQDSVNTGHLLFIRELQARLDPKSVPQWTGLQSSVYCKPGVERASDVFDIMRLPNGCAAVMIAGLAGEPPRSAIAMAEVRAAFRMSALHADPPQLFLRAMNWMLCEDAHHCELNVALVVIHPATGELHYCTAGTIGAVVIDTHGDSRELTHRAAPPAGKTPNYPYEPGSDLLGPDELLALFTPGCWSVRDAQGQALGEDRFVESLRDGFGQTASTALEELVAEHAAYYRDGRQPDDISIVLVHRAAVLS